MATYVTLINWTEQGIQNFRDTAKRAAEFTSMVKKQGGKVRELLWTVGDHDIVAILDVPDDETLMALLLALGAKGNVRTTTMKAFSAQQMKDVIERAG